MWEAWDGDSCVGWPGVAGPSGASGITGDCKDYVGPYDEMYEGYLIANALMSITKQHIYPKELWFPPRGHCFENGSRN